MLSMNILATILFNFKFLPFRKAIHFPFIIYNRVRFIRTSGKIILNCNNITFKMVQIGAHGSDMFSGCITTIDIAGKIKIYGRKIRIGHGSLIRVEEKACLELYENCILGAKNMIFCCNSIKFMENSLFSWDCQILDSDTHSLQNIISREVKPVSQPIIIGKDTWVGNHVIINKGTVLPNGTIVSAMTLCNKDYSMILDNNCVIGGIPAKLLKQNMVRLNDKI